MSRWFEVAVLLAVIGLFLFVMAPYLAGTTWVVR